MMQAKLKYCLNKISKTLTTIKRDQNKSILTISIILSIVFSMLIQFSKKQSEEKFVPSSLKENLDVFLPSDHVLYPIQVENFEAIDSLIGAKAYVRVYSSLTGKPLAENIKVLRAPKAPEQFAFVIPIEIAKSLIKEGPSFRLVIQKNLDLPAKMTKQNKLNKKTLITFGE